MLKYMITGMHGTVAPALAKVVEADGNEVVGFDRDTVNINDYNAVISHVAIVNPDIIIQCALGTPDFTRALADWCNRAARKFAYISTVDVFGEHNHGPYTLQSEPQPETDYGKYKLQCERTIVFVNHNAHVFRLGWMIGDCVGNNNMLDFLVRQNNEHGGVAADDTWYPSCAYLDDAAYNIIDAINNKPPELYLVNGNKSKTFYEIACQLKEQFPQYNLNINRVVGMNRDNIMIDTRLKLREV